MRWLKRALAAGLLWLAALTAASAAPGTTVAIGGALADSNAAVWQRLVALLASGPADSACWHVITLASAEPEASAARVAANLARHGGRAHHLPLPTPAAAHDPAVLQRVPQCRGVYMTGGAQARLLDGLAPGGQPTPLLLALRALWQAGGVVAGSSAGAAVLGDTVFRDAPDPLAVMKGRLRRGHEWDTGFGWLPPGVVVDQHAVRRGRIARLLPLMRTGGAWLGVAVEENSAVEWHGTALRVWGGRGALLADLSEAAAPEPGAFSLRGATLHWLEQGDRYELDTRRVVPAAHKLTALRLEPLAPGHRPYRRGDWYFADMLGDGVIVTAMTRLLDGDQRELTGLAFAARPEPDDPAPDLAFEWRLWLDAGTRGWLVTDPESATLSGVKLDITPRRLQRPLLLPWAATPPAR